SLAGGIVWNGRKNYGGPPASRVKPPFSFVSAPDYSTEPEGRAHTPRNYSFLPFVFVPPVPFSESEPKPPAKPPFFSHRTLIGTSGGPAQPDRVVVITGDRITALGKTGQVALPPDARTVDGTGKFLIPGLWDMHVHIAGPTYLPLFLANGVTGVRDMHAFYPD